ncbi:unnamed protein product, partial [Ectocarpus fasciculatus]
EETASSLPRQGEAHTGELGVRDALDHLNQVSRELRDAREMSDELLDIIRNTNPTTYEEILNSTKNTKLRDIMKKAKTTTGETTPEGFRRISALIQDNNQVFFDRFMASLSCGAKLKLADVEVLTRECHRQMASLVDERASGSSLANAGAQAGGNGSGGRGAGGASSASPPSLGGDNGNSDAGGRASDGEGAVTLPDLALVQNMAVADALPRFVNALLHQKEQEQQQQQQQQQQQPGVPKFTFGKARPVPSSPPGLKTVGTSTDNETGGAAAAAAAATVPPARCGESYTSARRGGGGGGGDKATPNSDGGGNFRESSRSGSQGPCPACEEEDAAVQRGALEGCQKCRPVWITPEEYERDSLVEMERVKSRTLPTFTAIVTEEEFRGQQQQRRRQQQWCYCDYHQKMLDQILPNVELENEGEVKGELAAVVASGDEEGQEKNKRQQYEEEEQRAVLREMETQVRKSLSVLWMSEGWHGVTGRREAATAGPLAEAFRATTLGETNARVAADRDPIPPTDIVIRPNPNLCVTTLTPRVVSPCEPAPTAEATTPTTQELKRLVHAEERSSKRFSEWSPIRRSPERSKKRWSPKRRASPPLLLLPESAAAAAGGGRPPAAGTESPSSATIAAFRSTNTEDGARAVAFSAFLWSHGSRGESGKASAGVTEASLPGSALRQFEHTLDFLKSTPAMGLGRKAPSGGTPTPSSICWRYAKTIALQRHRQEQQQRRRAQRRQLEDEGKARQRHAMKEPKLSRQRRQQLQQQGRQLEDEAKARQRQAMKEDMLSRQRWQQQQHAKQEQQEQQEQQKQEQQEEQQQEQQEQQQQLRRTEPISKQAEPTVRHKSTGQAETERRELASRQAQPKGEPLSPTKEDDRGFFPPPPLFRSIQWLEKDRALPQLPEKDDGKHEVEVTPPPPPRPPAVSPSPQLHGAASQHQQQRMARSGSTEKASALSPPVAGNAAAASVAQQQQKARRKRGGASWRSDSDMPARRKMFAAIVKFFEKYKPSTLPEWVHKVKKRTSFPIAVEALLYKQASSLGDYDDSTTVGSRVSHIIRSMGKEASIMAAMLKADETTHSNESKDEQQPHNCQTALASIPERGVVPSKDLNKLHMAQQAVRAAQTPEEKAAVEAKAMGAAAAAAAAPAYAAAAPAAAAVGSRKDEEGSRKQPAMSRAERRAAERERVKGAAKAAKSARLQQHLTQQSLRKNNDPRRVEGQLLAAADNPPPAGAQPVPPPETKPGDKTETKPGGKTGQKVVPDGGGDNGAGAGAGAGAAVNDIAALGGKRAAAAAAAGARTPPKTEKKAENETKTSATAVPSPTRTRTGVAVAAAAAGSRTSIPSEPAAAPGKAQTAQPARAAKAHAPTAATKREDSQAPAEERGNRAAARAPAAVLEETVTEMSSSRPSPGGEWTWPLMALDGGGALKGKRAAAAPLRRFAWIGRAADPTAGNRAEPVPWGNWKRWRDPEKWEKMVSTAITRRYSDAEYGGKL